MIKIINQTELEYFLNKKGGKALRCQVVCESCGVEFETKVFRLKTGMLCRKCKIAKTKKSVDPETKKQINEKRKQTNLEKYGVTNVAKLESVKEKSVNTLMKRYGVTNSQQLQANPEYMKKLNQQRNTVVEKPEYTDEQLDEHFQELTQIKTTKWETRDRSEVEKSNKKRKETCLTKYGVEAVSQAETVKQKIQNSSLKNWGTRVPTQNPTIVKKILETRRERYGVVYPNGHLLYDNKVFDSKWELALWIYAKDHNEQIQREPIKLEFVFNDEIRHCYPDFEYKGRLVELKGSQFLDKNNNLINPFINSKADPELLIAKQQCMLDNSVQIWTLNEMKPILKYVEEKYTKDYLNLFLKFLPFPYPKLTSKTDTDIIRHFHKSIYEASKKGKLSPFQAWQDKNLVKKSALNRLKYVESCTPRDILQGFSIAQIAPKVSVFKPKLAQDLINTYLSQYDNIYDPFSGFSGRMLGSYRCEKNYYGFDINEKHIQESDEIKKYLGIQNASLEVEDILTCSPKNILPNSCVLTCPPYGDKENWGENTEIKTCDEWIEIILQKYSGCEKYLFVVGQTERYKDNIVKTLENRSHLGTSREYVVLINKKD